MEQFQNKRKVVVYARVSTDHDEQLTALANQKDWYRVVLDQHPEWQLVKMYVDEGITGTSAKKRPQFMQMIEDANQGEFSLILTREVSRFARNTVDTLQYTRSLKAKGVEVYFINDNIKTFDGDGELRLTIMATLAQDESRKTSIRVKAGQQISMNNGTFYGNGNILGYDRMGKDMVINPEQADTVRLIYRLYLEGNGLRAIQMRLEQEGRLTATGKSAWYCTNISKILKNSFYCGLITYHKQYVPDFLEQKKINNFGEIEQTVVRGRHEPIITEEEFNQVQKLLNARNETLINNESGKSRGHGVKPPIDVWVDLMECSCGHKFNRKVWHKTENGIQYAYQCYSSVRTGTATSRAKKGLSVEGVCTVPMIQQWKMQMMAKYIFTNFVSNTSEVIDLATDMLQRHINDTDDSAADNEALLKAKEAERDKLTKRLNALIEMRADGEITKDEFKTQKEEISKKLTILNEGIENLSQSSSGNSESDIDYIQTINYLKSCLAELVTVREDEDLDDNVIRAFVRKIIVYPDHFEWYLRLSPDDTPESISIEGKRKSSTKISSFGLTQHRLLLARVGNNSDTISESKKIVEFSIGLGEAKSYLAKYSPKHKIHRYDDLKIVVLV